MTYAELMSRASIEQRKEVQSRVIKIIGTQEQATAFATDLTERVQARTRWNNEYEKLAKVFLENGDKALAMNFIQKGRSFEGVTASGRKWYLDANHGMTARSRYCGSLWVEGEGTVFTSGKLEKVFDYILNM